MYESLRSWGGRDPGNLPRLHDPILPVKLAGKRGSRLVFRTGQNPNHRLSQEAQSSGCMTILEDLAMDSE